MQASLPWNLDKLGMGFVALFFAGIVLLAYKHEVDKFYAAVDWDLLGFFAGLFVVINVMENAQVLAMIGHGIQAMLNLPDGVDTGLLLASSAVASSVTDNIPLAAMLANILDGMNTPADSPYWWSVIFGANLGGNITPIGSASTVVAMTIIQRQRLPLSFVGFVVAAVPFAIVQIVLAIAYVLIAVPLPEWLLLRDAFQLLKGRLDPVRRQVFAPDLKKQVAHPAAAFFNNGKPSDSRLSR